MQIDGISGTNSITGTNKTQSTSSIKQDTGGQIINQTIQAMNTGSTGQSNASFDMQTKVLNASLDSAQGAASSTSTTSPMFDMQTKVLNASLQCRHVCQRD